MSNALIVRPLPLTVLSTSGDAAGYAASNVANDYAGIIWRTTAQSSAAIKIDLGSDLPVDTVMLFGLGNVTSASTMTVRLATEAQGSSFGPGTYWDGGGQPLIAGTVTPTSGKFSSLYLMTGAPSAVRYVLVLFSHSAARTMSVARLVAGQRIQLERNFAFGGTYGVRDLGAFDFSPRGVLLRRRSKKLRTVNIAFPHTFKDEIEDKIQPLLETIGNTEPIALVTDPDAHAQRQNRMYFGPLIGELANTQAKAGGGWEWRCPMVSLF